MSEIKVNKISPVDGGTDITLGDSGDTFTVPSGATILNSGTATGFGGGVWNKIVRKTVTVTDTIIEFDDSTASEWFSADYKTYKLIIQGLEPNFTSGQKEFHMLMSTAGAYATSDYDATCMSFYSSTTAWNTGVASTSDIRLTVDNIGGGTGMGSNWEFTFEDPLGVDNYKAVRWEAINIDHNTRVRYDIGVGMLKVETALDGFKFFLESDEEFRDGTATLYGLTY